MNKEAMKLKQALEASEWIAAQQEPWLVFLRNNPKASCETVGAWLRGYAEHVTGERFYFPQQPAQRKPLTDEEIENIMPDDDTPMSLGEAFVKFARAIEAAHNIKENT